MLLKFSNQFFTGPLLPVFSQKSKAVYNNKFFQYYAKRRFIVDQL